MVETWAEQDLLEYDKRYSAGSDETERRLRTCDICGRQFDFSEGKCIELYRSSPIRIKGQKPEYIVLCGCCYRGADDLEDESEGDYEI